MRVPRAPHAWRLTPKQAVAVQRRLAGRVRLQPAPLPERVVGLDCAFLAERILAAAVVWDVAAGVVVEQRTASDVLRFPYVPGLLSFREVPVLLKLLRRLETPVAGILCDGQGIAHPRRLGLAAHLGLIVGLPTVGCAKSRLCGTHEEPGPERGAAVPLLDGPERIGTVVRSRDGGRPLYVSPGHLADHVSSVAWVLAMGRGYRLPEPTRLADRLVAQRKQRRAA
ncbi:MAG: endonuclease V [Pseudomonadales bacterium]